MANQTTVQLKRSSVAGKKPDAANVDVGEPVVNLADKIIFTKDGTGNVIVIGAGTTSNVEEGNNLYFTDGRVATALTKQTLSNASFSSTVYVGGELTLGSVGGDEGAQINFGQAAANSTLAGDTVTLDIFQNKLRIFEQGGDARGAFIDISACSPGVGTNLLTGGTGGSGTITSVAGISSGSVSNAQLATATVTSQTLTNATFSANVTADKFISNNNGNGENYRVGDDAWIGDINLANSIRIKGNQDAANAYINFGTGDTATLGRAGTDPLTYTGAFTATGNVSTGNVSGTAGTFTYSRLGTVESGIWQGSSISTTYTDAKITSVAGQTGAISNTQLASAVNQTGILTTANVTEVTNQYFTNARVVAAVVNTTLSNITVSGPISGLGYSKLDLATYGANTAYLTTTSDDSTALFMGAVSAELYAFTNIQIRANTGGVSQSWTFNQDGTLTFPDSTVQTTAFTTSDAYSNAKVYANVTPLLAAKADLTGATFTGNVIATNLLPPSDDSGTVGDAGRTWNNGHFTNLTVDTLGSISGTLNVRTALDLGTDDPLRLGDNDDIEIYHDGTNSYIDLNSGNLVFRDSVSNRATFVRTTGDLVLSTGNAQANYFVGDGSALTNVIVANSNITGNIISSKLEPTGVTASTYGNAKIIPVITVDQQGRITSAANVSFSGGDVVGPASSTDNALVRFDGTGGKTIQGTPVTAVLDDSANLGLGIAASGAKLHLYEDASGPTLKFERGGTALNADDALGFIDFNSNDNSPSLAGGTRVRIEGDVSSTSGSGRLIFQTAAGGSTTLATRLSMTPIAVSVPGNFFLGGLAPITPDGSVEKINLGGTSNHFHFWGFVNQTPADTSTDVSLTPMFATGYNIVNTISCTVAGLAEGTAGTNASTSKFFKDMGALIYGDDSGNFVVAGAPATTAGVPAPFTGPSPGIFAAGTTSILGKATIVATPPAGVVLRLTNYGTTVPTRAPITATYFAFNGRAIKY
jgi:hypothetical protein